MVCNHHAGPECLHRCTHLEVLVHVLLGVLVAPAERGGERVDEHDLDALLLDVPQHLLLLFRELPLLRRTPHLKGRHHPPDPREELHRPMLLPSQQSAPKATLPLSHDVKHLCSVGPFTPHPRP